MECRLGPHPEQTPCRLCHLKETPRFTSRETLLAQLKDMLFAKDYTSKIVITGLGGIEKTQLALELLYCIKEKRRNCLIMWIPVIRAERFIKDTLKLHSSSKYRAGKIRKLI